jgi:hypothetical protein
MKPSQAEVDGNPRSRSAILRVAERTAESLTWRSSNLLLLIAVLGSAIYRAHAVHVAAALHRAAPDRAGNAAASN